jgi:hypothetical protein
MSTRDPFPGVKCGPGLTLTTHPHLVLRSRMSRSYNSPPPYCLHAIAGLLFFTLHNSAMQHLFGCLVCLM